MRLSLKGFITCKDAERYSDCADHYAYNMEAHRFAISDGVTKSFFPKLWSKILVEQSVASSGAAVLPMEHCQDEWLSIVTQKMSEPDVKWFTRNAFVCKDPGLATLVTLSFDDDNLIWTAEAIGDSFLFFVPDTVKNDFEKWDKLSSKPDPVEFDNYPDYLSSRGNGRGEKREMAGYLVPGTFYLMTDALSEWLFNEQSEALRIIDEEWNDQKTFELSIARLRAAGRLHNDDTSALIIRLDDDNIWDICDGDIDVTDLDELIEAEQAFAECRKEVHAAYLHLNERINELLQTYNISENAKDDIKQQLTEEYALPH
jgi:hypothetical protein